MEMWVPVCDFDAFNIFHNQYTLANHARLNLWDHYFALHMGPLAVQVGLTPPGVGSFMLKIQLLAQQQQHGQNTGASAAA